MKKILFIAYGGGHINIIDLVAEKLSDKKDIEFNILALTTAYNKIKDKYPKGVVKKLSDYKELFQKSIEDIQQYGLELLDENYHKSSGVSEEDTIFYIGVSMLDLVQKYGRKEANRLYGNKKRQAFLPVETMKKILKYEQVNVVVSTTSPRFEQASFIAANELGLKTIEILDLFGELYPLPEAKHIVCMNKDIELSLRRQGLKNRRYYHFGQPVIENTVNKILNINQNNLKKKLGLTNKKVLLFATQQPVILNEDLTYGQYVGYDKINNQIFNLLLKLYKDFNISIILRVHPSENPKEYAKWIEKYPFVKIINDIATLEESLAVCDLLVNQASTVSVEAISANKPVFTFKSHLEKIYPLPALTKIPFIFSDGFEELEYNLYLYLKGNLRIETTSDFLQKHSIINIVKLIKEL